MTDATVLAQLTQIMRDLFDNDSIVLTPETTAADVENWDSLNHIALTVAVESKFGIKFKTAELEELLNVGDFVHVIEKKLGQKNSK
jgi:acyl carrier protein